MKAKLENPPFKICEGCGIEFKQRNGETNHKFKIRRFCKAGCNAESSSEPVLIKDCLFCKTQLERKESESKEKFRKRVYCNKKCSINGRYVNRTHKVCNLCKLNKPISDFAKRRFDRSALFYICKNCFKIKRSSDIQTVIKNSLRCRLRDVLKSQNIKKFKSTLKLLGCSIEYLINHLESKFQTGMTWNNYGKFGWHIDHIKPCSLFDLTIPEEQQKCFHYTNLQPLWALDNLKKHNKHET